MPPGCGSRRYGQGSHLAKWEGSKQWRGYPAIMGNAALRDIAVIESQSLSDLAGSVVAVDAHNWLYKYLTTTVKFTRDDVYTTSDGAEVANLIGAVQGLAKFFEHDITPVFVFDGTPTELKAAEIESRRADRAVAEEQLVEAKERGDEIAAARLRARTQTLTEVIHETTRGVFDRLDVPYLEAPAEGEAQCAHMARHDPGVDFAGSDDYDTLLFGAPVTIRQLTSSGDPERMLLDATLTELGLTWEQLVDVGLLCGTDFNAGIDGVGPKTAVAEVKKHGDIYGVLEERGENIESIDELRSLFRNPPVTDEYSITRDLDPDIEQARVYVTEQWEIPSDEITAALAEIEESVTQTGLDRWST